MNKNFFNSRRFRHGSLSVAISAAVIAIVIILNAIISGLAAKHFWYLDMTQELIYTLSDSFTELVGETIEDVNADRAEAGEDKVKITITFCDEKDNIMADEYQRYIYDTVVGIRDKYPETIELRHVNIWENPSEVNKYKTTINTYIDESTVIVESGTEFRVYYQEQFYVTENNVPWAYNGEKRLASAILAVTRAESPIACITTNHGETRFDPIYDVLDEAGYKVEALDLSRDEIPEDCRLIVTFNPQYDFAVAVDGDESTSEVLKLKSFLEDNNSRSFMVFTSPTSKPLPNLEEYLELWGVSFDRTEKGEGHTVKDRYNSLTSDGQTVVGEYVKDGLGNEITFEMTKPTYPAKVIFKNAMPISLSDCYTYVYENNPNTGGQINYGLLQINGEARYKYDIFVSSDSATAVAGGATVETATNADRFAFMTITEHQRVEGDDNYGFQFIKNSSFVLACGSTEFAKSDILNSNVYGNREVLLSAFRVIGMESVPTNIEMIAFTDTTIDTLEEGTADTITAILIAVPAILVSVAGIVVFIRRKYR